MQKACHGKISLGLSSGVNGKKEIKEYSHRWHMLIMVLDYLMVEKKKKDPKP